MAEDTRYCDCDVHGPNRHAYYICTHLLNTKDRKLIAHHKPWDDKPDGGGELLCAKPDHTFGELCLVCEDTLLEIGLLLPGETRLT